MEEKFPYTYKREKQRFSIRKTKAWGACSVFLGTSILFLSAGTVARADTTADASTRAQVVVEQKTTVNTESTGSAESSANSTSSTVSSPSTDSEAEATTPNQNKSTATNTEKSASETQSSSQNSASSSSAAKAETTSASSSSAAKAETTSAKTRQTVTKISYNTLLQQLRTSKALATDKEAPDKEALTHVTKDNFLDYFSLNGSATYDPNTGIVTITPDENDKVGNFSLKSKIDMNSSFKLTGKVNLGNKTSYRGGADGIGFAFHNGNTTDVGNAGGNLGIGGLQNAIGFKLDTWHNDRFIPKATVPGAQVSSTDSNGFGWSQDPDTFNPQFGAFVTTDSKEIKAIDENPYQRWWATTDMSSVQELSSYDLDGHFHDFVVSYNGGSRLLTINYTEATRNVLTGEKNVLTWEKTVDSSYQAMAMIVSASTGGATNLQQFKITSCDFKQAATVNVKYVDTKGNQIAQGEVTYPNGANVNGTYTTEQLEIPNYKFVRMDDGTATGAISLPANGTLTKAGDNGTVIYVYAYAPNTEKAKVTYIDDTTGKTLSSQDLSGDYGTTDSYRTADSIKGYESQGYELVSDNYPAKGVVYNQDGTVQSFEVHLKHSTHAISDKKSITETITYKMSDDSKAPDKVEKQVEFSRVGKHDDVTNTDTWNAWQPNTQSFSKVPTPEVKGYTPDIKSVEAKTVTAGDNDITVTVTYNPGQQKAKVLFIDDTAKKTLDTHNLTGVTNGHESYSPSTEINQFVNKHYVLVSSDYPEKGFTYDNDDSQDQEFEVHLKHGITTVTPDNPGKPGEPVDPDNPDGPKYPDGTDEYQVKRTGTQTIHYVGAGDKTPADNKQTFIFTREITFDDVTGKIISVTPWNVQSHTFGNVDTPVIPGYHADKAVAGGETVTSDDLNKVITVTYAPDGNPGNPSDHGDTPSPEPTPEPNPTPDDQPDSEASSDEHFENVKPKDKLDKTNPKKVDAYKKQRKIIKTKIAKQGHTEIAEPIEDKVTRENNVKVVSDPVENKAAEPKLPQTGEADNSIIGLLGMLLASFAAMFGFDSLHSHDKKHKN